VSDSGGQTAKPIRGARARRPQPADATGPLDGRVRGLLAAGDGRGAATEALRELGPPVLRYLRVVLRDEEDAGEAFSRFAERCWRGLPGWRGERLRPWAFRIAWSSALDVRGEAWRRRVRRFESGEASALAEQIRTRTAVRVERQRTALEKLREALSSEEQSLLTLRIEEGLGWEDIAEVLSTEEQAVSADTAAKRFERLKARLARMAREAGLLDRSGS
jgi:RNA polymerase sigma-70 factor (ECF subfamily)